MLGGTTDDTRTVIVGAPTDRQKQIYTKVLRGHINLAMQRFPEGTGGIALDALARTHLWNSGLDYGHWFSPYDSPRLRRHARHPL